MDEMQDVVGEVAAGSIEVHGGDVETKTSLDQDKSDEQKIEFMR